MTEPVVQPLMRILPFHNDAFTWERFESFCLAVVRALPEVRWAERRAGGGERQGEVDIDAVLADGGLRYRLNSGDGEVRIHGRGG
jgi:hypothetical protein